MKLQKDVCKLGDIICMPLQVDKFIYGRVMREASIQVFNQVFDSKIDVKSVPIDHVLLTSAAFFDCIESGDWTIEGSIPFESEEQAWPPPVYIQDILNPEIYKIFYKGELSRVSKEDIEALGEAIIRKPSELINFINEKLDLHKKAH